VRTIKRNEHETDNALGVSVYGFVSINGEEPKKDPYIL
jgi:hypothetical protein